MNKFLSAKIDWVSFGKNAFYPSTIIWEKVILVFAVLLQLNHKYFCVANTIIKVCGQRTDDFIP